MFQIRLDPQSKKLFCPLKKPGLFCLYKAKYSLCLRLNFGCAMTTGGTSLADNFLISNSSAKMCSIAILLTLMYPQCLLYRYNHS